jgi:TrmH family RNA methyltransferase
MITIRKLASLPRRTRLRKTVHLLEQMERECLAGRAVDRRYLREVAALLSGDERLGERVRAAARLVTGAAGGADRCRDIDGLRNALLAELGREPAEWDLLTPDGSGLDRGARAVRDFFVYLEDLRSPYNVGSIFRTAESFGVRAIYLSPQTARPDHPRAERSSMGATGVVPWRVCGLEEAAAEAGAVCPAAPGLFALETGGEPLETATLPEPGLVVLGSEELGVSPDALARAEGSGGRVSIPTAGAKASLNVSVAFGILAHAWWAEKNRPE